MKNINDKSQRKIKKILLSELDAFSSKKTKQTAPNHKLEMDRVQIIIPMSHQRLLTAVPSAHPLKKEQLQSLWQTSLEKIYMIRSNNRSLKA